MYVRGSLGHILADVSRHIKEAVRRAFGKQLAKQITPAISQDDNALAEQDASTQGLIRFYRAHRK